MTPTLPGGFMGISTQTIIEFALTCVLIELTPGPNMTYLALISARDGRRAGFAAILGVALGLEIIGLAAALGLAETIAASPRIYSILRWGGVAYLCWLAWEAWRDNVAANGAPANGDGSYFLKGLITNLLNPKAAVFYIAVLPPFLEPAGNMAAQAVTLATLYVAVATAIHITIVSLAGYVRPLFANPRVMGFSARFFAAALLCVAAWLAWSTR